MELSPLDIGIILGFLLLYLIIGWAVSGRAQKSKTDFFLGGGKMPWWLLGVSMVATTFAADTPNFVTEVVRKNGVSGNWNWWAFLLTGMLTVFVYSRLWRRAGIVTDLEFYELRYSGRSAEFLRGFRAIYLGVFFNVVIMATVSLAAIKIGGIMLGLQPWEVLLYAGSVTVVYSALGGLRAVIFTDLIQFVIALGGAIWAAVYLLDLPEIGGLQGLLSQPEVIQRKAFIPDLDDPETLIPLLIIPLAVQWWSTWYPGSEPGGGGYVAQRMLSARDERHALRATLFFNVAHFAVRPWPWILVALCSLLVFPDIDSISSAFPAIPVDKLGEDLAYPAMLSLLPSGLLGLVVASLASAYMSTISTHLNWGASYVVNDVYLRFVKEDAPPKTQIVLARTTTVVLMLLASAVALYLESALEGFNILLQIGAGTGAIFILRWFWWRINAWTEISGMLFSLLVAVYFTFIYDGDMPGHWQLVTSVVLTTSGWLIVTLLTTPESMDVMKSFFLRIHPRGPGWKPIKEFLATDGTIVEQSDEPSLATQILGMFIGTITIYAALFGMGYWIYGQYTYALISLVVLCLGGFTLYRILRRQ